MTANTQRPDFGLRGIFLQRMCSDEEDTGKGQIRHHKDIFSHFYIGSVEFYKVSTVQLKREEQGFLERLRRRLDC